MAHLSTLHFRDVAVVLQLHPVGLVQLGPNQEVEIDDLIILSYQGGGQTQLTVGLDYGQNTPEHSCCMIEEKAGKQKSAFIKELVQNPGMLSH